MPLKTALAPSVCSLLTSLAVFVQAQPTPWPEALPIVAGQALEEVQQALGKPSNVRTLEAFDPKIMKGVSYRGLGLELILHDRNGLCHIDIYRPWVKPIFGIRIGDTLASVRKSHRVEVSEDSVQLLDFPQWFVYSARMPGARSRAGDTPDTITKISFHDLQRYGNWHPRLPQDLSSATSLVLGAVGLEYSTAGPFPSLESRRP